MQRGRCHVKKSKQATTERNRGAETGASNRRGLPSPSPLNNRNGLISLEGWGGGWGEVAQGCLPPGVVAYVRYNYIGAGRFCGVQWK